MTSTERSILKEFMRIMQDARGATPALAEVRRLTAHAIDSFIADKTDASAIMDEIDAELESEAA